MAHPIAPAPLRRAARAFAFTSAVALGLTGLIAAPAAAEPRAAALERAESGHVVTNVMIDGDGPWRFAVDTGASHTAIAMQLAAYYGFVSTRDELDDVQALTGRFEAEHASHRTTSRFRRASRWSA